MKDGAKIGSAAIFKDKEYLRWLPDRSSIYDAEIVAISLTLDIIKDKHNKIILFSVVTALRNKDTKNPLITEN